jgi:hypothetical protein
VRIEDGPARVIAYEYASFNRFGEDLLESSIGLHRASQERPGPRNRSALKNGIHRTELQSDRFPSFCGCADKQEPRRMLDHLALPLRHADRDVDDCPSG